MTLEDLYRLLRAGHVQSQGIVDTITQAIVVLDKNLCVTATNSAFLKTFEVEQDDVVGENFFGLGNGQWDITELRLLIAAVIPKAAAVVGFVVTHDFPNIGRRTFLIDARRLSHPNDNSTSILVIFDDVTERQRHDAQVEFVLSETRHRMKNLFAVVRALAMQTPADNRTAAEYRDAFLGRLEVTLRAQELTVSGEAEDFEDLLRWSVSELGAGRLHCKGETVKLSPARVLPVGMILHELTTNAAKYGALSVPHGEIHVEWTLETVENNRMYLICEWREKNGPPVTAPSHKGYGTELIQGTASHLGGTAELSYRLKGLEVSIKIPL